MGWPSSVLPALVLVCSWNAVTAGSLRPEEPRDLQGNVGASPLCLSEYFQEHGYIEVGPGVKYFFMFIKSYFFPESDPTVIWQQGESGLSGLTSFLTTNGPCTLNTSTGTTTFRNSLNWNQAFNVLWIDEPAGVGFSTGTTVTDVPTRAAYMRNFTINFFKKFSQYNHRVYFFGSSQAGLVIPKVAKSIYEYNEGKSRLKKINLVGIALINALVSMRMQYASLPKMAYDSPPAPRRITEEQYDKMNLEALKCVNFATLCNQGQAEADCDRASEACQDSTIYSLPKEVSINMYDLRQVCQNQEPDYCRPYAQVETFLNRADVKQSMGVDPKFVYKRYNPKVDKDLRSDASYYADSYEILGSMMDNNGLKLLVVAGDCSYMQPWATTKEWLLNVKFSQQDQFKNTKDVDLKTDKTTTIGQIRYLKLLHGARIVFVKLYGAGQDIAQAAALPTLETLNYFILDTFPV
ncbi:hypothetical protein FOZ60_001571 [Perkinsus olseni]|uniref:Thymus-specific serine protease n=3 Tax=Perkinsus olseni TaxID=32597 RepID=A0A7J6P0C2_PEROL|nr:hypothetical protein FOZ60_001571 [Perkinsus olseni]